jgi:hypothetical protein
MSVSQIEGRLLNFQGPYGYPEKADVIAPLSYFPKGTMAGGVLNDSSALLSHSSAGGCAKKRPFIHKAECSPGMNKKRSTSRFEDSPKS